MKKYPNNKFLTVQPISANSILIDPDRQVEERENIKFISKLLKMSNRDITNEKKRRTCTLEPFNLFSQTPIVSTRQLPPKSCQLITFV
jgi:hypothetical protein